MKTTLKGKHFLCEQDWTNEELETLMDVASALKMDNLLDTHKYDELLKNKSLFMLFFEESTRTRNAFECGITQLGGHGNYLTPRPLRSTTARPPRTPSRFSPAWVTASACATPWWVATLTCRSWPSTPRFPSTTCSATCGTPLSPSLTCSPSRRSSTMS